MRANAGPRVQLAEKQFVGSDDAAPTVPKGPLTENNFIHRLTPTQIQELRQNVQFVNCSNCGASINLESNSACPYCHSPISMLDMKQPQRMLDQLKQAAAPKPLDPMLPMKLASAKLQLETSLADH